MPYRCAKRGSKWRIVDPGSGSIMVTKNGKAVDGGGHESEEACQAQVRALYANVEDASSDG